MKIDDPRTISTPALRPATPAAARPSPKPADATPATTSRPAALVELSARSRELHDALQVAAAAPDVRADKVAAASRKVAGGTYHVDAEQVARRLLDTRA